MTSRFSVERMQVNSVWSSPPITIIAGGVAVDMSGWTFAGFARGPIGRLDLSQSGRVSLDGQGRLVVAFSQPDCAALGVGRVHVEIMRATPTPAPRPILRFFVENYAGV